MTAEIHAPRDVGTPVVWRLAAVGFAASLIGIGLSRFAYSALVPLLIAEAWLTPGEAAYLGAVNLGGYLLGALVAWPLARLWSVGGIVRACLVVCAAALLLSALPWRFAWLLPWRLFGGIGGGLLMVLTGPAILACVPPHRWGLVSGVTYSGIGLGVALSGTLVPLLAHSGAVAAWLGIGALAVLVAAPALRLWRVAEAAGAHAHAPAEAPIDWRRASVIALALAYGLYAIGLVPHTLFWVDYLARGAGLGLAVGGVHWGLFGLGALIAPLVLGRLAGRYGFARLLPLGLATMGAAAAAPFLVEGTGPQVFSSLLVGGFVPGIVVLAAGRGAELCSAAGQRRLWWLLTLLFAVVQGAASFVFSAHFDLSGAYAPSFLIAGGALAVASLAVAVTGRSGAAAAAAKAGGRRGPGAP